MASLLPFGALAPGSRTEVLIPSKGHWIPLRGIGGGMGIISPLRASSAKLASPLPFGALAPGSRTEVLIPSKGHWIPLRGIGGGMGIISPLRASSAKLASPLPFGALAPGSRTEVLIPSKGHWIPLRGIGGGMGIRTPDLLIANETLYQLSYTPNMINFKKLHGNHRSKKDACLYRHEIMDNYAAKKIRSKIKTHALRSASGKVRAKTARALGLEREDEALSTLRAFLPDNLPAHLPQILRQFFLCPTRGVRADFDLRSHKFV